MKSHPAFDLMDEYFRANFLTPRESGSVQPATSVDSQADSKMQQQLAEQQAINEVGMDSALVRMLLDAMNGKPNAS